MSRLVARILLSMLLFPVAFVFFMVIMFVGESLFRARDNILFLVGGSSTWVVVVAYWLFLWRSAVKWTPWRINATIGITVGSLVVGAIVGAAFDIFVIRVSMDRTIAIFIGSLLAMILWLLATVLIWRETTAERAARVKSSAKSAITCPTCGYNLTGLSESRCPECGSKFTLDELLALQPTATEAEIE